MSFKESVKEAFTAKERFEWLDQFRGLVILIFIIQTTAHLLINGTGFPIFAPHLNHGWTYAEIAGWPPLITLMDVGKQIFIFLVGFMAAFSVNKMKQKERKMSYIWIRILRRLTLVLLFNVIVMITRGSRPIEEFLINSTLGYIAWVGFIVAVVTLFLTKADYRFLFGLVLFTLQFILDLTLVVNETLVGYEIWMNSLGLVGVGLIASAFASWILNVDGTVNETNFKKRILPVSIGSFLIMFVLEFFQWANHETSTVAHCAIAIGISGLALFMFYQMEKYEFKIPLLTPFGKNMLTVFLLGMVLIELVYVDLFLINFINNNLTITILHLIFAGLIPILVLWGLAKGLEKLNLFIRL